MKRDDEQMIMLATAIAMELSCGLDVDELEDLRNFINQIACSISNLITRRYCMIKKNSNKKD